MHPPWEAWAGFCLTSECRQTFYRCQMSDAMQAPDETQAEPLMRGELSFAASNRISVQTLGRSSTPMRPSVTRSCPCPVETPASTPRLQSPGSLPPSSSLCPWAGCPVSLSHPCPGQGFGGGERNRGSGVLWLPTPKIQRLLRKMGTSNSFWKETRDNWAYVCTLQQHGGKAAVAPWGQACKLPSPLSLGPYPEIRDLAHHLGQPLRAHCIP